MTPQQRTVRIAGLPSDWHELQAEGLRRIQNLAAEVRPELPRIDPLDPRPAHVHWWFEDDMGGSLLQWTAEVDEDGVRYGFSFGAEAQPEGVAEIWAMDTWVTRLPPRQSAFQRLLGIGVALAILGTGSSAGLAAALSLTDSMGGSATLAGIFVGLVATLVLALVAVFVRARVAASMKLEPVSTQSVASWRQKVWDAVHKVDGFEILD